jgi:threonine dehydrogenase-like Zn-dependent dehydrogenase
VVDKFTLGAAFAKGLTLKMGQTHVHTYLPRLLQHIERGDVDPSFLISHRLPLAAAPAAYELFEHREDDCTKVVLAPNGQATAWGHDGGAAWRRP